MNLVALWRRHDAGGLTNGPNGLVVLAMRVLSVVPNSAATERIFSKMGIIHSKLRSRMSPEKVRAAVLVSEDIARRFPRPTRRLKRSFGDFENADAQPDSESSGCSDPPMGSSDSEDDTTTVLNATFATVATGLADDVQDADTADSDNVLGPPNHESTSVSTPTSSTATNSLGVRSLELQYLFNSSTAGDYYSKLWTCGQINLGAEIELHEVEPEVPAPSDSHITSNAVSTTLPSS